MDVELPPSPFLGLSAITGDVFDAHEYAWAPSRIAAHALTRGSIIGVTTSSAILSLPTRPRDKLSGSSFVNVPLVSGGGGLLKLFLFVAACGGGWFGYVDAPLAVLHVRFGTHRDAQLHALRGRPRAPTRVRAERGRRVPGLWGRRRVRRVQKLEDVLSGPGGERVRYLCGLCICACPSISSAGGCSCPKKAISGQGDVGVRLRNVECCRGNFPRSCQDDLCSHRTSVLSALHYPRRFWMAGPLRSSRRMQAGCGGPYISVPSRSSCRRRRAHSQQHCLLSNHLRTSAPSAHRPLPILHAPPFGNAALSFPLFVLPRAASLSGPRTFGSPSALVIARTCYPDIYPKGKAAGRPRRAPCRRRLYYPSASSSSRARSARPHSRSSPCTCP
jgi:hypothetical protein